ncbi:MAG: hypothetical protein U0995_07950 [Erythrobacter sp.]|nr:hypothetical protein [Erythrobacter sp.]MDZ4138530.1 hypothetical protein [Erythrobacter sp.]MDZ4271917.1 hypothetical protein [Erythrobacter sp.]MDZ4275955.1 hypothetical protein [Erythrobacter sp.]
MIRNQDVEKIAQFAGELSRQISGLNWFAFGSCCDRIDEAEDLDLIVIYEDMEAAALVRASLREFELYPLLDVSMFSAEEQRDHCFIERRGAMPLEVFSKATNRVSMTP